MKYKTRCATEMITNTDAVWPCGGGMSARLDRTHLTVPLETFRARLQHHTDMQLS